MKRLLVFVPLLAVFLSSCNPSGNSSRLPESVTMSKEVLLDKIKGGWAGQTIGCSYGGPTEFDFKGGMITNYTPIPWPDGYIKWWYETSPGLYDDVYMDLTFVEVFDRLGLDAPEDSIAMAFATAEYRLWHANQAARYNILNGIMPPESGHWLNNPHADDLDYQIEADFAGLMSPGMPNSASEISDKVGHIMCYGDGWYGGVYVGAMYALAFVSDDMEFVVTEALKTIPKESKFYQCINDVIGWHKQYPDDWQQTWFEATRKWNEDVGCPSGVFGSFNIDAVINSAYIVIGLLYGEKDFFKTMDIATRCGQDSDCNPASAAGVLGTMIGYSNIPEYWMKNLREVEDMDFAFTHTSLNKVYNTGFRHALEMIQRNGGTVSGDEVTIKCQNPVPVRLEQSFEGHYPVEAREMNIPMTKMDTIEFEGTGAVFRGKLQCDDQNYVAEVDFYLDGQFIEQAKLPVAFHDRRQEICYKYQLPKGNHKATLKWKNPRPDATFDFTYLLVYSDAPRVNDHARLQAESMNKQPAK